VQATTTAFWSELSRIKQNKGRKISIIMTAAVATTLAIGIVTFSSSYTNHFQTESENPYAKSRFIGLRLQEPFSISSLNKQGSAILSKNPSAPITVIEFGDFQSPFCGRFTKEIEPQINQTYIQTGKVNFVFEHFTIIGSDSKTAVIAAQCTSDQGKFWNYYKILYGNQGPENSGWTSKDNLKKFASHISSLNMQKFNSCFDNEKYKSLVENNLAFASSLGLLHTPSFIIVNSDGSKPELVVGVYPFSVFKEIIDKKMAAASG
jgi:protein-disulfide isomerase